MAGRAKSLEWFSRAQQIFPGGVNSPVRAFKSVGGEPFIVERGAGPYLFDLDGNRYIDYINSWGPLVLGHAHAEVVEAISRQASLGTTYGACHKLETQLAEEIVASLPSIEMIRFVNSGTEAAMSVVRVARAFTARSKIVKFEGCYHGHVDALLARAGSGVMTLSLPDCAGIPESITANTLLAQFNDLGSVEELLTHFGKDVAAIIVEPVVGNCGLLVPDDGFLSGLRRLADLHGVLLIFDEVMTGFRVSLSGAQGHYNVKPDLTMLGKVIGGGLPVGAFGGRRDIMSLIAPIGPVYQAGTLSGNPLAMAAGLTTLRIWKQGDLFEQTAKATSNLITAFRSLAKKFKIPLVADSVGTMFGFFFQEGPVRTYEDTKKTDRERFNLFFKLLLEEGVFIAPSPFEAGFVSAAHLSGQIQDTIDSIERVLAKIS